MPNCLKTLTILGCCLFVPLTMARPYPGLSGLAASADTAETAASNPAGIVRFNQRAYSGEIMWFTSESEWESEFTETGEEFNSKDSGDTVVPRLFFVQPLSDRWAFSFTFLGTGFSDDLGEDWPGRYFITEYSSVFVSAFPSLAYRVNDKWSVAGSVAITYTKFEQERAVANLFDPGFGDGKSELEADSVEVGFGLSTLYQSSPQTRWGLTYQSEIEPSRDADNDLSGLGPNTEAVMERLGLLDRDLKIESTSPQSVLAGVYHEFDNDHAVTLDVSWIDFSNFRLSEFYYDGEAFVESSVDYDDIYALIASYTWPVSKRWMLGVSGLVTNEMLEDEERTMTLRLDSLWSVGVGAEWQWTDTRAVSFAVSYFGMGDAPVRTAEIEGIGALEGEFKSRDTFLFQIALDFGGI